MLIVSLIIFHAKSFQTQHEKDRNSLWHGTQFPAGFHRTRKCKKIRGITAEAVRIDKVAQALPTPYAVILDRISHDVPFYRAYLKNAALTGCAVINNPFWWTADDKFFNNCLAIKIGVPVPKTVILPSHVVHDQGRAYARVLEHAARIGDGGRERERLRLRDHDLADRQDRCLVQGDMTGSHRRRSVLSEPRMIDLPDSSLTPLVLRHARRLGAKPALVDSASGRAIAYGDLPGEIAAAAGALANAGHRPGDVVGVVLPNVPEFAVVFHATLEHGGVVTPVNPALTTAEIGRQLDDAGTRFVITSAELEPSVSAAAGSARVLVVGSADLRGAPVSPERTGPDDLAALPYSSGTTGFPKGVMLTHRNLTANIVQVEGVFRCDEDDVLLAVLPYFHIYGLTVNMNFALARGATVVTMARFDLTTFLETLERHRVTRAFLVPPILLALAKHPLVDRHDLSSLDLIVSGAAPSTSGSRERSPTGSGAGSSRAMG